MILKTNLPSILLDNDAAYLEYVERAVLIIDELAKISVLRALSSIAWHIECSSLQLKQPVLKAVLKAHRDIGIFVVLSSTINTSPFINFQLPIENI